MNLGIGIGMMLVSFFVVIHYNVIIAYAIHYLVASFSSVLPWTVCNEWWNKAAQCPQVCSSYIVFTVMRSIFYPKLDSNLTVWLCFVRCSFFSKVSWSVVFSSFTKFFCILLSTDSHYRKIGLMIRSRISKK